MSVNGPMLQFVTLHRSDQIRSGQIIGFNVALSHNVIQMISDNTAHRHTVALAIIVSSLDKVYGWVSVSRRTISHVTEQS